MCVGSPGVGRWGRPEDTDMQPWIVVVVVARMSDTLVQIHMQTDIFNFYVFYLTINGFTCCSNICRRSWSYPQAASFFNYFFHVFVSQNVILFFMIPPIEPTGYVHQLSHHSFPSLPQLQCMRTCGRCLGTVAQLQETFYETAFATSGTEKIPSKETTIFIGGNGCFGW